MFSRRDFIITSAFAAAAKDGCSQAYASQRPAPAQRAFVSDAVEATIASVKRSIADPELGWMFENCFPNTVDTTVRYREVDGQRIHS